MELCNDNHEEIVHDERDCPVCYRIEKIRELKSEIEIEKEKYADFEKQLDDLIAKQ